MDLEQRISAFSRWGHTISAMLEEAESSTELSGNPIHETIRRSHAVNRWFTPSNSLQALRGIADYLDGTRLQAWLNSYQGIAGGKDISYRVGLVMAGNIPAVGFHDLLCVLASGNHAVCKLSSDDEVLIPFLTDILVRLEPGFKDQFSFVGKLDDVDAVIATGSNNSARYFEYYFRHLPHIIRRNRNGVAVLSGAEGEEDLVRLGLDIFTYFGMGCRSISKLYVPSGYDFSLFFSAIERFSEVMQHNKYMNNYDYHRALFLLNNEAFLTNNFLILRQNPSIASPVSVLHYEYYADRTEVERHLELEADKIQCVVGEGYLPFGRAQAPGLSDYADRVDTMKFLSGLKSAGLKSGE